MAAKRSKKKNSTYRIIGADSRQYGPVDAAEVLAWIQTGRADAKTLAQEEGSEDWKPLSEHPEFAEALSAGAAPGAAPELPPPVRPGAGLELADEVLARGYTLRMGACFDRAWQLLMSDPWPLVGVAALVLVLLIVVGSTAVGIVAAGPLWAGLYWYYLKRLRNEAPTVEDAFAGFTIAFLQTMLCGVVTGVLIGVGLALCIVPGLYLLTIWSFPFQLIMDKKMEFWSAMEVSRKVVSQQFWSILGFALLTLAIWLGGALLCGVGLFLAIPWTTLAWMYAYEDIFNPPQTDPAATAEAGGLRAD